MEQTRKPKLIAGLLAAGIVVVGGGGILAATLPSSDGSLAVMAMMANDVPQATASRTPPAATPAPAAAPVASVPPSLTTSVPPPAATSAELPPVTYTVVRGDTLSGIAAWFALHGYGDLYAANSAVIGADPDLIVPGETITISGAGMVLSPAG